jgi:ribonuclease J
MGRVNADIPIYAGAETKDVLGIIADFINAPLPHVSEILESGKAVRVGDIQVLPLSVNHSAYGALMLLIRAEGKSVLYTGDFNRINPADFTRIGKVDALLCEGTNIENEKTGPTEEDVLQKAAEIMRKTDHPVFVLSSATNIDRIKSVEKACRYSGKTICTDLFLDAITAKIGAPLLINPVGFMSNYVAKNKNPRQHKYFSENGNYLHYCGAEKIAKMTNLVLMVRPTMGAFMKRLNRYMPLSGSVLIYSMWRGYKNKTVVARFLELCRSFGVEIVDLHASGHAYKNCLRDTIARLNPETLIPIHTESPEDFADLHGNVLLPADSEIITV